MDPSPPTQLAEVQFVKDRRRWWMLALFSIFSFSNAIQWINYAPVVDETKSYFGLSSFEVNMLSMIYTIVYPIGSPLTIKVFEGLGLKLNLICGASLNVLGCILKLIAAQASPHYGLLFFSQFINATAQLFILSIPPLLSTVWFCADERTLATSIAANANNIGVACGLLLPPLVMGGGTSTADLKSGFTTLFVLQLCLCGGVWLAVLPSPRKPSHPPSFAAHQREQGGTAGDPTTYGSADGSMDADMTDKTSNCELAKQTLHLLKSNAPFRFCMVATGISLGSMWCLSTVLAQAFQPFGITETQAGWSGFSSLLGGTTAAVIVGTWVDKRRLYKNPLLILLAVATGLLMLLSLTLVTTDTGSTAAVAWGTILYALSGTFQNATLPIFFEYALELSFPVPEAIPATLMMGTSNALSFIFIMLSSWVLGDTPGRAQAALVLGCAGGLVLVSGVLVFFVKSDLKRLQFEKSQASETPIESDETLLVE